MWITFFDDDENPLAALLADILDHWDACDFAHSILRSNRFPTAVEFDVDEYATLVQINIDVNGRTSVLKTLPS